MQLKNLRVMIVLLTLSICSLSGAVAQNGDSKLLTDLPRQFAAVAYGQSGPMSGKTFGLNVYITDWTTDQQAHDFISILKEKGPDALVDAMSKAKEVGRVSPTGFVGNSFRYARYRPTADGGLHIVLMTDRPMTFGERYRNDRSTDYPFGIIALDVDKNGKGRGTLAPVCKVKFNKKNELEIEHYGTKPFRVENVYLQK